MSGKQTVLFLDEIHRWTKTQQDSLLPVIESGRLILIGATTENPSFSCNNALLSRCTVLVLDELSVLDLTTMVKRALGDSERGVQGDISIDDGGREHTTPTCARASFFNTSTNTQSKRC